MAIIFKWVQLSDIHFQNDNEGLQTDLLREKLCDYLQAQIGECNALFLCGDYRYAPASKSKIPDCSEYLLSLADKLGLKNEQVIAVPGNHDLKRGDAREALIDKALDDYSSDVAKISPEILKQLINGFSLYHTFCKKMPGIQYIKKSGLPHCIVQLDNCDVLLLNTALVSGKDNESGRLVLGSSDLHQIIKEHRNNMPIIAVGHHSLSELQKDERAAVTDIFKENGIHLYLCGHAHNPDIHVVAEELKEITVGCIKQDVNDVVATFSVGEIKENGDVIISSHRWDRMKKNWYSDPPRNEEWPSLYSMMTKKGTINDDSIQEDSNDKSFSIKGYRLIGGLGVDGIKYLWSKNNDTIESIAFNRRLRTPIKPDDLNTSAYTISTSTGCFLSTTKQQCRFCETGTMPFRGLLSAREIALQCVFMAEYDSDCKSYEKVKDHSREFAFMGQGEPGFNYPAIRSAIIMTDYVMEQLKQKVSRYIISTCGIPGFMPSLIEDIKSGTFMNKVTVHFSLNEIENERSDLMPIEETYSYKEFIEYCKSLYRVSGEKIGVGILMFDHYKSRAIKGKAFTLEPGRLKAILDCLDKNVFKIDLCTVNSSSAGRQNHQKSKEAADKLLEIVETAGFEGKIFMSFGDTEQAGCGMLSSSEENMEMPGKRTIMHFERAVQLVEKAEKHYHQTLAQAKIAPVVEQDNRKL